MHYGKFDDRLREKEMNCKIYEIIIIKLQM